MVKRELLGIFRPRPFMLILLGVFLFVAYGGDIQRWGFTYDEIDRADHPPPFLYDQLRDYPFWLIWIILIIPLIGLGLPIAITTVTGAIASVLYFYLLTSVIAFFLREIKKINWFDDSPQIKS